MPAKNTWPARRLGELAEFRNGVNYNKSSFGEGIKVVGVSDFQDYTKPRYERLEQINPQGIVTERNILRDGDVVFVRSNGNRELIGRSLFIELPPEEVTHSAFTIRLRFTSREVLPKFYAYCFRTPLIRKGLTAHGGGTNISNLNQDILGALEVPVPPLPTQQHIAGILAAYDDLIDNDQRRVRILEAMAYSLYREWFVDYRFPGHEKIRLVPSPLGNVPEGWGVNTIADLCESISYGYTASAVRDNVGPKFLRITDIVPEVIDWDDVPCCQISDEKTPKYLLRPGDIVIARTGATTGYAKRLNELHPEAVFASYLVRVRAKATVSNRRLGILLESPEYKEFIKTNIGGSAQPQANAVVLSSMRLANAPPSVSDDFDRRVKPFLDEAELLSVRIRNLRHTRDLLLPRLLSGQLNLKTN